MIRDSSKLWIWSLAAIIGLLVCWVSGINRGTTVSLSLVAISGALAAASVAAWLIGRIYFSPSHSTGTEPALWRLKREWPHLWIPIGIAISAVAMATTFAVGLYIASTINQNVPGSQHCELALVLDSGRSYSLSAPCQQWIRVKLQSGQILRPCIDEQMICGYQSSALPASGDQVLVAIQSNRIGTSIETLAATQTHSSECVLRCS